MSISKITLSALVGAFIIIAPTHATEYEITPYIGKMYSSDLVSLNSDQDISIDSTTHYGVGLAWQESPNGQGQILINYAKHDLDLSENNDAVSFKVIYAHFNGVAQFRQRNYMTTVSVGLGVANFDTDAHSEISPSLTAAVGTRYQLSQVASIVTEVRAYASLMQDGDKLFCQNDVCNADYDDAAWVNTTISIGFSYKF